MNRERLLQRLLEIKTTKATETPREVPVRFVCIMNIHFFMLCFSPYMFPISRPSVVMHSLRLEPPVDSTSPPLPLPPSPLSLLPPPNPPPHPTPVLPPRTTHPDPDHQFIMTLMPFFVSLLTQADLRGDIDPFSIVIVTLTYFPVADDYATRTTS